MRAVIHLSRQKSFRFVYSANSKKDGSQLCHTRHLKHVLLGLTFTMPCTHWGLTDRLEFHSEVCTDEVCLLVCLDFVNQSVLEFDIYASRNYFVFDLHPIILIQESVSLTNHYFLLWKRKINQKHKLCTKQRRNICLKISLRGTPSWV